MHTILDMPLGLVSPISEWAWGHGCGWHCHKGAEQIRMGNTIYYLKGKGTINSNSGANGNAGMKEEFSYICIQSNSLVIPRHGRRPAAGARGAPRPPKLVLDVRAELFELEVRHD